jgi:sodium-coupled monocarboxylate transporter 8/12
MSVIMQYAWKDKRKQNTSDFLLGGREMTLFPVTLSLMASFLSAILVLGVPTEIFYNGTMYWMISFGMSVIMQENFFRN